MDEYITQYIVNFLKISHFEANSLRRSYWQQYGTTLNGLRAHYEIDPHDYFNFIHSGERITKPRFNPEIRKHIENIKGKKWVFTNGRADWASSGLTAIGIEDLFEDIFDIEFVDWSGKPYAEVYHKVIESVRPKSVADIIFLDDKIENIKTAKDLGWNTVWLMPDSESHTSADYVFSGIKELFESVDV